MKTDYCDGLANRHGVPLGYQDLLENAVGVRLKFDHGLVRLDFGYRLARSYCVSLGLQPTDYDPLLHVIAHLRHGQFGSH